MTESFLRKIYGEIDEPMINLRKVRVTSNPYTLADHIQNYMDMCYHGSGKNKRIVKRATNKIIQKVGVRAIKRMNKKTEGVKNVIKNQTIENLNKMGYQGKTEVKKILTDPKVNKILEEKNNNKISFFKNIKNKAFKIAKLVKSGYDYIPMEIKAALVISLLYVGSLYYRQYLYRPVEKVLTNFAQNLEKNTGKVSEKYGLAGDLYNTSMRTGVKAAKTMNAMLRERAIEYGPEMGQSIGNPEHLDQQQLIETIEEYENELTNLREKLKGKLGKKDRSKLEDKLNSLQQVMELLETRQLDLNTRMTPYISDIHESPENDMTILAPDENMVPSTNRIAEEVPDEALEEAMKALENTTNVPANISEVVLENPTTASAKKLTEEEIARARKFREEIETAELEDERKINRNYLLGRAKEPAAKKVIPTDEQKDFYRHKIIDKISREGLPLEYNKYSRAIGATHHLKKVLVTNLSPADKTKYDGLSPTEQRSILTEATKRVNNFLTLNPDAIDGLDHGNVVGIYKEHFLRGLNKKGKGVPNISGNGKWNNYPKHLVTSDEIQKDHHISWLMIDELNSVPKDRNNYCVIVNLDKHNQPGSHWVIVMISKPYLFYMDPFGKHINKTPYQVKTLANKLGLKLIENTYDIQPIDSNFCGQISVYMVKKFRSYFKKNKGITPEKFEKIIVSALGKSPNDEKLEKLRKWGIKNNLI